MRAALLLLAPFAALPLCRYTVRDVAFVDLGDDAPYTLVVPAGESTADLRRMAAAVVLDSNVELEARDDAVGATLVDPDDRELPLTLGEHLGASLAVAVESPRRRDLVDQLLASYGAVVLALSTDEAANDAARAAIDGARDDLAEIWTAMPKAVGDPPVVVELPVEERAREAVLLWSLGIEPGDDATPAVAVLMGRARRVGPALSGEAITRGALFGILTVVGQSCECDLDRSWMRGRRVPLRWDADTRARAVGALGFDPESPLVKAEIAGILARGPSAELVGMGADAEGRSVEELLLSYTEVDVEAELAGPSAVEVAPTPGTPRVEDPSPQPALDSPAAIAEDVLNRASWLALVVLGLAALGSVLLFVVVFKGARAR